MWTTLDIALPIENGRTEGALSVRSPRVYTIWVPLKGEDTKKRGEG